MYKKIGKLFVCVGVLVFGIVLWMGTLLEQSENEQVSKDILLTAEYREQNIGEEMCGFVQTQGHVGESIGVYLLESEMGYQTLAKPLSDDNLNSLKSKWKQKEGWESYISITKAIWDDVKYFPIPTFLTEPDLTVSYTNSWMSERTFGGKRGHEGTDIMADKNVRGLYPVLSMTDGTITKKGWLEKGGYRIGVTAPGGAYFYYAHLDSYADLEVGDVVKAGDILGFMGDSGYGEEGTVGVFAVHLHLGIYVNSNGNEVSVNPYWVLRYIENKRVKCYTEV